VAGNRTFKKLITRGKRFSFYLENNRIKRLGWSPGEQLIMRIGSNGEAYISKLDGIPITLCHNKANNQWFVTFPALARFKRDKGKVRIIEHETGFIINFF
jgi:hypothetical protein